jgi:glyoxylase-like metal-dependent hydrolase (beta-lactamase superfamily II)
MPLGIETLVVGAVATNCYLVYEKKSRMGLVIDPGGESERIIRRIEKLGLAIDLVVNTHGHIDHILGDNAVAEATGSAAAIHPADEPMLKIDWSKFAPEFRCNFTPPVKYILIDEGERISCGGINLKIIHTPGHSPGSISLYTPGILFSGDTLFYEDVGRDDLPGGDFQMLSHSILEKLYLLPPETEVYPGHGPTTTLGHEMSNNPSFHISR